jgi:hypothetical protein
MDDVSMITFFVDKYKMCKNANARVIVQGNARRALSTDDYVAFLDFAIAHLHVIDPVASEDIPDWNID